MLRKQRISILGVGDFEIEREHSFHGSSGELGHVAHSTFLVCPKCRLVWATLQFPDEPFGWPVAAFCRSHEYRDSWHLVSGSILTEEGWGVIDDALLDGLPPSLVKREFELHMKAYGG